MRALLIVAAVVALILGLLLTLRSSRNAGMPGEDVLKRTAKRAREQAKSDEDD
ncbi:MAG: DUF2897 family protein [Steroidobacteraceae bacterium]|jgi:hypothetical protein